MADRQDPVTTGRQRGDLAGARAAYERAERRGDPDAAFNLGVLLYEAGDLKGAEATWRRCISRGHPQAAANLRFLMQRRVAPADTGESEATEATERASRQNRFGESRVKAARLCRVTVAPRSRHLSRPRRAHVAPIATNTCPDSGRLARLEHT